MIYNNISHIYYNLFYWYSWLWRS